MFAARAHALETAQAAEAAATAGQLWGVALEGATAVSCDVAGEPWLLVMGAGMQDETAALVESLPHTGWAEAMAATGGSDPFALGLEVAYLLAKAGV